MQIDEGKHAPATAVFDGSFQPVECRLDFPEASIKQTNPTRNFDFIANKGWHFIAALKNNRLIALT
jgi:hypothetical protein